jgi:hypothetical protein
MELDATMKTMVKEPVTRGRRTRRRIDRSMTCWRLINLQGLKSGQKVYSTIFTLSSAIAKYSDRKIGSKDLFLEVL